MLNNFHEFSYIKRTFFNNLTGSGWQNTEKKRCWPYRRLWSKYILLLRQKLYHDITWMNKTYILDLYFMLHDLCLSIFRHINIFCTKCQRVLLTLGMANIWDWWILESNFLNNINKPSHTQPSELMSNGDNSAKKGNLQMLREWW